MEFFLKIFNTLIFQSNSFDPIIVEEKRALENFCFTFISGILLPCLILDILCVGIIQ